MAIKLAPANSAKVTITAKVPSEKRGGYEKRSFKARIKKLYGDDKKNFMDSLAEKKDVEVARDLVTELEDLEWFATDEHGAKLDLRGDTLAEFFDEMEKAGVDYIMGPLARECVNVQDEGMRRMLEAKN